MEKAQKELEEVKIEDEVTDVICEECGRNMVVKYGPMVILSMPWISRVPQYKTIFGKDRYSMSKMWWGDCDPQEQKGKTLLWMSLIS